MRRITLSVLLIACSETSPLPSPSPDSTSPPPSTVPAPAPSSAPAGELLAFTGSGDGKIRVYAVDDAGAWTLRRASEAGEDPSFLAIDAAHRRVIAIDERASRVRSFSLDAAGGLLELGSQPSGGSGPAHVSIDRDGRNAFVASYGGGTVAVFPIGADGSLGPASDQAASGAKSHWAGLDPSGTHLFVPALGVDAIRQYVLSNGKLTANGAAAVADGAGPRHLVFALDGRWAWSIDELAVTVTTFDVANGQLTAKASVSALPDGVGAATGAEIAIHPNGKVLYASTRGFDSIAVFTIEADGTVTRRTNVETGAPRPRSFALDPAGTRLYAGNESSDEVVSFPLDERGDLGARTRTTEVPAPKFVGLARVF